MPHEVPDRPLPIGAGSRYLYANMWRRFVAFQATPEGAGLPLTGQVAAFVTTLTPAQAKLARAALKCYLGPRVEWDNRRLCAHTALSPQYRAVACFQWEWPHREPTDPRADCLPCRA